MLDEKFLLMDEIGVTTINYSNVSGNCHWRVMRMRSVQPATFGKAETQY